MAQSRAIQERKAAIMAEGEAPVLYEQDGAIVTVTMNRPKVMNNFGGGLIEGVAEAAERFNGDDSARVMILTGKGRAFCAGADLKAAEARTQEGEQGFAEASTPEEQRRRFFQSPKFVRRTDIYKPMIAAVNGYCVAGGMEVALACHFLIGAESSKYGILTRRWGGPTVDGGTYRLPLTVGLANALYLIQTGKQIDAAEAYRIGLIQEIVPDEQLMDRAREIGEMLAAVPQPALVADTESVLRSLGRAYDDAMAMEAIIASTVQISGEALGRFVSKDYDPETGTAARKE